MLLVTTKSLFYSATSSTCVVSTPGSYRTGRASFLLRYPATTFFHDPWGFLYIYTPAASGPTLGRASPPPLFGTRLEGQQTAFTLPIHTHTGMFQALGTFSLLHCVQTFTVPIKAGKDERKKATPSAPCSFPELNNTCLFSYNTFRAIYKAVSPRRFWLHEKAAARRRRPVSDTSTRNKSNFTCAPVPSFQFGPVTFYIVTMQLR